MLDLISALLILAAWWWATSALAGWLATKFWRYSIRRQARKGGLENWRSIRYDPARAPLTEEEIERFVKALNEIDQGE